MRTTALAFVARTRLDFESDGKIGIDEHVQKG